MIRRTAARVGFRGFALGLCLLLCSGCSDDDDSRPELFQTLERDPTFPGQPGAPQDHARLFDYTPSTCGPPDAPPLNASRELRVFRGPSVSDADLVQFLGGLQRYYDHYGVKMFTRHAVITVPLNHAMVFDVDAIAKKAREQGVDVDREPTTLEEEERILGVIGRLVMYNVREFLSAYGEPRLDTVNVLLLKEMVGGDAGDDSLEQLQNSLLGIGFSPELLRSFPSSDPAAKLYEWVAPSGDFTPIAILGTRLTKRLLTQPDIAIAHEVGHAHGLPHTLLPGNLMTQGALGCDVALDAEQLGQIGIGAVTQPLALSAESFSVLGRASDLLRSIRAALSSRRDAL